MARSVLSLAQPIYFSLKKKIIAILAVLLVLFSGICFAEYVEFTLAWGDVVYQDPDTSQDWSTYWGEYKGWWAVAAGPAAPTKVQVIIISKRLGNEKQ